MIRLATAADLPRLEDMGARFFAAAGLDRWFHYKPHCFSKVVANFMDSDQAVVLVGEELEEVVGMAAALVYPCWFDSKHLSASEFLWWVEPAYRGGPLSEALRRGMEDWARERGCQTMEMGALDTLRPEALTALYKRKGYEPKERIFCKRLT